jgi:hypothetical protein
MWHKLEMFYRMWYISTFNCACFEVWEVCTGLFERVYKYRVLGLKFWAAGTQYHLWCHPERNGFRNLGCNSMWHWNVAALQLLMRNCNSLSAMCVMRNSSRNSANHSQLHAQKHTCIPQIAWYSAESCQLLSTTHNPLFAGAVLNVWMVLRHKNICAEMLINYGRLLILIFVFALNKRTLFYLVDFYCLVSYLLFIFLYIVVSLELEPTLQINEFTQCSVCTTVWTAHCSSHRTFTFIVPFSSEPVTVHCV